MQGYIETLAEVSATDDDGFPVVYEITFADDEHQLNIYSDDGERDHIELVYSGSDSFEHVCSLAPPAIARKLRKRIGGDS